MKKLSENKNVSKKREIIFAILTIVLIVAVLIGVLLAFNAKQNHELVENEYTLYLKINPLIKINFKEEYTSCNVEDNKRNCQGLNTEVYEIVSLNDDGKKIIENVDVKGKSVIDVLTILLKKARENGFIFEQYTVISDYEYFDEIKSSIEDTATANIIFKENISDEYIIEEYDKYTVTFNTDGANNIDSVNVGKNETISKPSDPVKSGYKFIGWYLNDELFDFSTKIEKNITLVAKWEKEESNTNLNTSTNTSNSNNSNTNDNNTNDNNTNNNTNNNASTTTPTCQAKKFNQKYSYVYSDHDTCMKQGNIAFFDITDNVDSSVFAYDCEEIVDDCGDKYWGVYFWIYDGIEKKVYY